MTIKGKECYHDSIILTWNRSY